MNLYKQFGTDKNLEQNGVIVSYGEEGSPEFKLARMGGSNVKYKKALERAVKPHKHAMKADVLPTASAEKLVREVFVETVLLGWKNVTDSDGVIMEFNKKNALKLFHDLPDLYADLSAQAEQASLFQQEEIEAEAKN